MQTTTYNVFKVSEGGPGQRFAVSLAKSLGAKVVNPTSSIYVGHTAIVVTATKRVHQQLTRTLYR